MANPKDTHEKFSTCFEKSPWTEIMHKTMSEQGLGSLCAEMMAKIMERPENGWSVCRPELMRKMMEECNRVQEEPEQSKEERSHERKEPGSGSDE